MTLTRFLPGGRTAGLIVALTMTATLAACSSADSDESSAGSGDGMSEMSAEASDRSVGAQSGGEDAGEAEVAGSDSVTSTRTALQSPPTERHVISTGTVSLISDDVAKARRDVQRIVDAQQGSISEENTETDDEGVATYSRLVVRVPSRSFTATLLALEESAELRRSQLTSDDVTTEVIDTDVRVRAQEGSLRRVEQLLARARSLKDIVWIESQLTQRQSELDSLKSQQAWLSDQTSYSTITIDIERKHVDKVEEKKKDEPAGFLVGLQGGMKALGAFATAMATIIGALLPFAIVLAVLGLPMWVLVRRTARRRQARQPATS